MKDSLRNFSNDLSNCYKVSGEFYKNHWKGTIMMTLTTVAITYLVGHLTSRK